MLFETQEDALRGIYTTWLIRFLDIICTVKNVRTPNVILARQFRPSRETVPFLLKIKGIVAPDYIGLKGL